LVRGLPTHTPRTTALTLALALALSPSPSFSSIEKAKRQKGNVRDLAAALLFHLPSPRGFICACVRLAAVTTTTTTATVSRYYYRSLAAVFTTPLCLTARRTHRFPYSQNCFAGGWSATLALSVLPLVVGNDTYPSPVRRQPHSF
jgi:hypothetical protein